ncbi:uncharacterized protein LY89DRAFT_729275 [Mollisia scopiformis]|uniref:Nonsense-mediated mRNA decay factor n=1 Tax=Mollisia scopiformis TaxID=149040 RepID=A0A194XNN0_MOLSC|nr:uncharacterized protein LY89DRAFT_729275 [Mollisia scopiformis]KUJ21773.1 hypothetical protein LY89DRAFT_729275 [Mollisia scopiformis]
MANKPPIEQIADRWNQHLRRKNKITPSWACTLCPERRIFNSNDALWEHAQHDHLQSFPSELNALQKFREEYEAECAQKTSRSLPSRDDPKEQPNLNEANRASPEPPPSNRPLSTPTRLAGARSISGLGALNLGTPAEDVDMRDLSDEAAGVQPRKRAAIGDGISAGSASPFRDSSASPPPRRSKARPTSAPFASPEAETRDMFDVPRPTSSTRRQLWTERDAPLTRSSVQDSSNIASVQVQKARKLLSSPRPQKPSQVSQSTRSPAPLAQSSPAASQNLFSPASDDSYDIIPQPETRPISQEQLVAEVKGIYAGLVMVEAKCIEVDNKQAILAQGTSQPKLNNEQWQALIALHRTLLHKHHDFFLASQHPSASPALRRLASKYAMPARMWRHGIHSFLELLRHRLPASLDHMLAFIYLAYSMMALLYETVPAFEDAWIECLGDLGRYRMAIEDDDIRDREVWTGVARHWYSKASDKAPTIGRLYHHLAVLARPNAVQQLFYYSKSLCVAIPFTSARESILTLFDPILDSDPSTMCHRLPPLDIAFVKAHGLLFTNKTDHFSSAKDEFLTLLDNQIGRVTRKFMEQGFHIAIANSVALTGFAPKDNILMQIVNSNTASSTSMHGLDDGTPQIGAPRIGDSYSINATLQIVLQRIGDPNVLPFIHVTLVFMHNMTRRASASAMVLLQKDFPWDFLAIMLNTSRAQYKSSSRIEAEQFPIPAADVRPFPEDFAIRGLLWAEDYFPAEWFTNEKIDEEEDKPLERPSMFAREDEQDSVFADTNRSSRGRQLETFLSRAKKAFEYLADILFLQQKAEVRSYNSESLTLGKLWCIARRTVQCLPKSLAGIVLLSQMQVVSAMPTGPLSPEAASSIPGTIALAAILGSILAGTMYFPHWRETSRLVIPTGLVNIACYSIGMDSRISAADLAVAALFAAGLNILLVKDKLRRHMRTGGLMALIIAMLGMLTAFVLASSLTFQEGERYSNQLTSVTMGLLPGTFLWEVVFLVLVQLLGPGAATEGRVHSYPRGERSRSPVRRNPLVLPRYNDYRFQPRAM